MKIRFWFAFLIVGLGLEPDNGQLFLDSVEDTRITSREGCMEILICSGLSSSRPIWHKRDGDGSIRVQVEISNTSVEYSALKLWQSSIIYQTLRTSDKGLYDCTIENTVLVGMSLDVLEGLAEVHSIPNVNLSSLNAGEIMEVQCYVDTCLSDIIIQFISGDELLKSSISIVERGWNGTLYLEVAFHLDGEYFCQVMNDNANIMLNESFVVSGFHIIMGIAPECPFWGSER